MFKNNRTLPYRLCGTLSMVTIFTAASLAHAACWLRKSNQRLDRLGFPQVLCLDSIELSTSSKFGLGDTYTKAALVPNPGLNTSNTYEYVSDPQNDGWNGFVILKQFESPTQKPYFGAVMTIQLHFVNDGISNKNLVTDGVEIDVNTSPDMAVTPTTEQVVHYQKLSF